MTSTPVEPEAPVEPVELEAPPPEAARRVRALAALTAVLIVLGLVGLAVIQPGKGGSKAGSLATVLAAVDNTTKATSARMVSSTKAAIEGSPMKLPSFEVEGLIEFGPPPRSVLTMTAGPARIELVGDGSIAYMTLPDAIRGKATIATPWVSVDTSGLDGGELLQGLSGASLSGGGDPTATLESLRANGVVQEVTTAGHQTVRGAKTTKYHLVLDPAKYRDDMRSKLSAMPFGDVLAGLEVANPVMDLFVDDDGMVRRFSLDFGMSLAMGGEKTSFTSNSTTDLFDFGTPVVLPIPPADQVTRMGSIEELFQLLGTRPLS
jgi:hypothetical protein